MKIQMITTAMIAAVMLFQGCTKEDSNNDNPLNGKEEASIFVKVERATVETRAEADRVQTGDPLNLGEGHIFFCDINGVITKHVEIKNGAGAGQVDLAELEQSGSTINNVSTTTKKCYIFSKLPSTLTLPTISVNNTNISVIKNLPIAVNDLHDATEGVAAVPLWGEGNVDYNAQQTGLVAPVQLKAIGSRLQIAKFTGYNDIVSYQIDGIFVNNYFGSMPITMVLDAADIINNTSDMNQYTGSSAAYNTTYLYDYSSTGLGRFQNSQQLVCTPTVDDKVWAYNILPTQEITPADPGTMPHIVVRLSNVVYNNGQQDITSTNDLFLTVQGMKTNVGGTETSVQSIIQGRAYTFTDIRFEYSNLTTVPEVRTIDAVVTVEEMPWEEIPVDPEY